MALTPILLPGNMCDARLWRGGDDVIGRMLQGRGLAPAHHADLTLDGSIAAMAQRALVATQGPVLPIGFSMGAIVAVEMAVQAPGRIAGLVLAGYNATADLPARAAHRPLQQAEVRLGGLERVLVEELKPNYLGQHHRNNAALLGILRAMGLGLGADVFLRQSEALRLRQDRRASLAALAVPVLYLCGHEDKLCPSDWHHTWADLTGCAHLDVIAAAGHMLPLEAPDAFAASIQRWLTFNKGKFSDG